MARAEHKTFDQVMDQLRAESLKHEQQSRVIRWIAFGSVAFLVALKLYGFLAQGKPFDLDGFSSVLFVLVLGLALPEALKSAMKAAAELKDPRFTGYLLEAYYADDNSLKTTAEKALESALPAVRAEHSECLTPRQLGLLQRYLNSAKTSTTAGAALDAVHAVCGSESLPVLAEFERRARARNQEPWTSLADRSLMIKADLTIREARALIQATSAREDERFLEREVRT